MRLYFAFSLFDTYDKMRGRKLIFATFVLDVSSREKATLLEFPVTPSTECSRVSSRSYVFTLDTDSLLITFANETGELLYSKLYSQSNLRGFLCTKLSRDRNYKLQTIRFYSNIQRDVSAGL